MGANLKPKDYTFLNTTPVSLATIMGTNDFISNFVIRANSNNAANVEFGDSTVTTTSNIGGFLKKDEALSLDLVEKFVKEDRIYVCGSTSDRVHILEVT